MCSVLSSLSDCAQVQESTIASVKWGVYGLAAMTVIAGTYGLRTRIRCVDLICCAAGVILQCYGLTRVFQVDPSVASHEGRLIVCLAYGGGPVLIDPSFVVVVIARAGKQLDARLFPELR